MTVGLELQLPSCLTRPAHAPPRLHPFNNSHRGLWGGEGTTNVIKCHSFVVLLKTDLVVDTFYLKTLCPTISCFSGESRVGTALKIEINYPLNPREGAGGSIIAERRSQQSVWTVIRRTKRHNKNPLVAPRDCACGSSRLWAGPKILGWTTTGASITSPTGKGKGQHCVDKVKRCLQAVVMHLYWSEGQVRWNVQRISSLMFNTM